MFQLESGLSWNRLDLNPQIYTHLSNSGSGLNPKSKGTFYSPGSCLAWCNPKNDGILLRGDCWISAFNLHLTQIQALTLLSSSLVRTQSQILIQNPKGFLLGFEEICSHAVMESHVPFLILCLALYSQAVRFIILFLCYKGGPESVP